jgi:hypothetical protein
MVKIMPNITPKVIKRQKGSVKPSPPAEYILIEKSRVIEYLQAINGIKKDLQYALKWLKASKTE